MDAKLINPFLESTLHVLHTIANIKAEKGKPYLKKDNIARGDVSGIIGLAGDMNGIISVSFTEKCILHIVTGMFGEEVKEINEEIGDAVGEIANMISGQARQKLESQGTNLQAAIPSVVMGKDHIITHLTKQPIIALPFSTAGGEFTVEICFEQK
ncbi:MAG: chemotaxis protein CheX [Deltaproteobacteria bacterium]|nr:chemotaxis protein CheX [Deltaproteobacteria bacterium]